MKTNLFKTTVILAMAIFLNSCSNDDAPTTPPEANVLTVTSAVPVVTATQVTLGGEVTKDGGKPVTERGICIGETINPIVNDPNGFTGAIGAGLGVFTNDYSIDPSTPANTTFHYRAFAKNADGTAYGEDKTFTTLATAACNVIEVNPDGASVTISTPTTWTAGNVYIVRSYVFVESVLTIQPGVIIKCTNRGLNTQNSTGKIIANGTASNRIVFTSIADDSVCGDSNGDGSATQPLKGDWAGINLNGGTGVSFKYCDFLYAGKTNNQCITISPNGSSFTFDNCTFAHTLTGGSSLAYAFYAPFDYMKNGISIFTNNAFYDNDRPIYCEARYIIENTNIFHNPSNVAEKNKRNGIFIGYYTIGAGDSTSWAITEVPYVPEGSISAYSGSTLNIGANVMVKFIGSNSYLQSNNSSVVLSSSAILTSYKDDTVGGDTNGDASISAPATGDWSGFSNTVAPNTTWIHSANIRYATN